MFSKLLLVKSDFATYVILPNMMALIEWLILQFVQTTGQLVGLVKGHQVHVLTRDKLDQSL